MAHGKIKIEHLKTIPRRVILLDTVSHYDESAVVKYITITTFDHAHCYKTVTDNTGIQGC